MKTVVLTGGNGKSRVILVSLLILLMAFALGACSVVEDATGLAFQKADVVQIGMLERSGLNSTQASFHTLTGRKSWRENLQEGDTLSLEYEADLVIGTLLLQVENPESEVIWEKTVTEGEDVGEEIELSADESGTYTIAVVGDGAGGEYELAWDQAK